MKLLERKTTKRVFTYYVITEGGGTCLKGLCMIMGEGEGAWSCNDISK